ncbi:MAG: protein-L-isoaspartate O-methyltransferase [Pseudomonadota bacterium]
MTEASITLDTATARKAMIDSQLRTSGVNEEFVLSRMMSVGREDFLPSDKASLAYIDRSIALENGSHLASPLFYGKLLTEADPSASDSVLIVDGGTGYLAALIDPLVSKTTTIAADEAAKGGGVDAGTYSLILIDGAIEDLPDTLSAGLADNGVIVGGMVERGVTRLVSGRKIAGQTAIQAIEDIGIPVLPQFNKAKTWTFS